MSLDSRHRIDQLAFLLLTVLMVDCAVFGGGSFFHILGVPYRIVLFAAFFFCSLPAVFRNFRKLLVNSYLVILVLWGLWTLLSAYRGYMLGNSPDQIKQQLVGFAAFGMLPGTICVLSDRSRILTLMKALSIASVCLFFQTLLIMLVYSMDIQEFIRLNHYIILAEFGGCTGVVSHLVRVFLRSHPCLILGCICSFYLGYTDQNPKHKLLYIIAIALSMMSLLISYTRSIYLGAFVGAVIMLAVSLILYAGNASVKKSILRFTGAILVCFLVILLVFDLAGGTKYLSYGLYRSTGLEIFNSTGVSDSPEIPGDSDSMESTEETEETMDLNEMSDDIRDKTKMELFEKIGHNKLMGMGLGAVLDYRAETDSGNEYFYLNLILTSGIIGLVLFVLPMLLIALFLILDFRKMSPIDTGLCIVWFASLTAIALFSHYNPYLTGVNGISIYCCTIAVFTSLNGHQQMLKKY